MDQRTRQSMPKSLKLYVAGVVALSAVALVVATLVIPVDPNIALGHDPANGSPTGTQILLGVGFWTLLTLLGSAFPVSFHAEPSRRLRSHRSWRRSSWVARPSAGWVAAIGTTELRELRGRIPWYGTLANHAGLMLPAFAGRPRAGIGSPLGKPWSDRATSSPPCSRRRSSYLQSDPCLNPAGPANGASRS